MILGVFLKVRVPAGFIAEHHFALDHRSGFAIAATEIEPDAIPLKVTAQWRRRISLRRQGLHVDHFDRVVEHPATDDLGIELSGGGLAIMSRQPRRQLRRAGQVYSKTAPGPEQQFRDALEISEIAGRSRVMLWKNLRFEP